MTDAENHHDHDHDHHHNGEAEETLGTIAEVEELDGCKRRLKGTVPAEKVREELERNYRELAKSVSVPGFRPGRVPRTLLRARFGDDIESEVKESLVRTSLSEVIDEKELQICTSPSIDNVQFDPEADLTYEAEFEVRPEFDLPKYKGIEVSVEETGDVEVNDDEIQSELEQLRKRLGSVEPVTPDDATPNDYLTASYQLYRDDVMVKSAEGISFQPSSNVLEDFYIEDLAEKFAAWEEHDQSLSLEVTVPPQYPDELLRGEKLRLELGVSTGYRRKLADLDDKLAEQAGMKNLDELKEETRSVVKGRKDREAERAFEEAILDKLADETEMEIPSGLVDAQLRRQRVEREQELLQQGLSPDEVQTALTTESAEKGDDSGTTAQIRTAAKKGFILEAIAEKEKVYATEADLEARLAQLSMHYGMSPAQLRDVLENQGRLQEWRQTLRHEKVRAFLRKKAKQPAANSEDTESKESPETETQEES